MMKKIHTVLLLSLLLLCAACKGSYFLTTTKLAEVQQGMTKQEITAILGNMDYRRFYDDVEEWEFRRYVGGYPSVVIVQFVDGRVASMDTFKEPTETVVPNAGTVVAPVVPPTTEVHIHNTPLRKRAMNKENFQGFFNEMKQQPFASDRIKFIGKVLEKNWITSSQGYRIVKEFSFDSEKKEVMKKIYPHITDKENFSIVVDCLTFKMDKDAIWEYVDQFSENN